MYKLGLLVPTTSTKRDWANIKESYLYEITIKTYLLTRDPTVESIIYIGIDKGDKLFDNKSNQDYLNRFSKVFSDVKFKFIVFENIKNGHLTKMWNQLFTEAYNDGCDYFFQCGYDISFKTVGWVNKSIETLNKNNNIGLTGPLNNNSRILTQAFVSRKHMDIFGYFFPEEIINWCCDDWYNTVYQPNYFFPLLEHLCINIGGPPRYVIDNDPKFTANARFNDNLQKLRKKTSVLAIKHRKLIHRHISRDKNQHK
jgi:hypothetical protein